MHVHVRLETSLHCELLSAPFNWTTKGLLSCMFPQMVEEVLDALDYLAARLVVIVIVILDLEETHE